MLNRKTSYTDIAQAEILFSKINSIYHHNIRKMFYEILLNPL